MADLIRSERIECEFEQRGTFYVYRDYRQLERARRDAALLTDIGVAVRSLDAQNAQKMEPALNNSVVGGHFFPGDASLRPDRFVRDMARIVRAAGGVIEEQAAVHGFRTDRSGVSAVVTVNGEYQAREIVLALGAWSPTISLGLGLRLPIQPGKGYSITYDTAPNAPKLPLFLKERAVCVTPFQGGFRVGSTMEFSGYDRSLNRARLKALMRGASEYLSIIPQPRIQEEWFGWRPMTPDDLPIIGRVPSLKNVTLATGHGMLGLTLSPITGLLIGEILAGRSPSVNILPFSPARFGRAHVIS
jgi:D-amino-acid dehydrogenase